MTLSTTALRWLCLTASLTACTATPDPAPGPEPVIVRVPLPVLPPEETEAPCPVRGDGTLGGLLAAQADAIRCERAARRVRRRWRAAHEEAAR